MLELGIMKLTYVVTIGSDSFTVKAKDNQEARYKAAKLFRKKYELKTSAADIASYAITKLAKGQITTEDLLVKLTKED